MTVDDEIASPVVMMKNDGDGSSDEWRWWTYGGDGSNSCWVIFRWKQIRAQIRFSSPVVIFTFFLV